VVVDVLVVGVVVTVVVEIDDELCEDELAALVELVVVDELPQPARTTATRAQIGKTRMCIT
jgi:hypothetical protein